MKILIKSIRLKLSFQAPKEEVKRLWVYLPYIKAGKLEKIPAKYRGIFTPVLLKKLPVGYLMLDGHHRIAMIKALGLSTIEAEIR